MKKDPKIDKNAQISAILYAFYALKSQKVVKSQRAFAKLAGVHEQSLSAALRGSDQYLTPSLMDKIEELARIQPIFRGYARYEKTRTRFVVVVVV